MGGQLKPSISDYNKATNSFSNDFWKWDYDSYLYCNKTNWTPVAHLIDGNAKSCLCIFTLYFNTHYQSTIQTEKSGIVNYAITWNDPFLMGKIDKNANGDYTLYWKLSETSPWDSTAVLGGEQYYFNMFALFPTF